MIRTFFFIFIPKKKVEALTLFYESPRVPPLFGFFQCKSQAVQSISFQAIDFQINVSKVSESSFLVVILRTRVWDGSDYTKI